MKKAVLYVCHGSRIPEARDEAVAFIQRCQEHVHADIQEICFLELASPSIPQGFENCVKKGATHISVVPLLLLTAVHAKIDIPEEIKECMKRYPSINVHVGRPIGIHNKMVASVLKKLADAITVDPSITVVLIGRGSSDPDVKRDLGAIGDLVQQTTHLKEVKTCFLTASEPSFSDTLKDLKDSSTPVVFIPYLLFTGILMREIKHAISSTQNPNILLGDYLGYDPLVEEAFLDRIQETLYQEGVCYASSYD
ncbi:sirohydrochlorin chelatase [Bacillus sp. KH172YL63]|uniref:sirohydrochlorin chelatase n=1 Tax=Bacillus sp. KH172YL63 TaxID=2709784 RepID=UPI0013E48340|nr:sirohydrochlorin chelatase [Bacillus sp. KH172YL63]BCB03805.1 sirohydrochlorin ferrochelatase [Bacillus sp. KH172YL63]